MRAWVNSSLPSTLSAAKARRLSTSLQRARASHDQDVKQLGNKKGQVRVLRRQYSEIFVALRKRADDMEGKLKAAETEVSELQRNEVQLRGDLDDCRGWKRRQVINPNPNQP